MSETLQSVWNFDGAELNLIFELKLEVSNALQEWNLEAAYWKLRDLRREIDAKLNRTKKNEIECYNEEGEKQKVKLTEKELIDNFIIYVEKERNTYLLNYQGEGAASKFYLILEEFYMNLASLMKEHGLYFREGDDPSKAIFRR